MMQMAAGVFGSHIARGGVEKEDGKKRFISPLENCGRFDYDAHALKRNQAQHKVSAEYIGGRE